MPLPQNLNVMLGAGVFGIVCAATLYVVDHYRKHDRKRHTMARDLARLDTELAVLRQQLEGLLSQQKQKVAKRGKRKKTESLISSSTTTEDYTSAFDGDSSDLEFYDLSDEDTPSTATSLEKELAEIDSILEENTTTGLENCLERLQNLCIENPQNPHLLWRLARAHYKLFEKTDLQEHLAKGLEACTQALDLKPELADVHKWLAVIVGTGTKFKPIKEKIMDAFVIKKHIDLALKLNPLDSVTHHMLGRFCWDLAELKWYERKVAAALAAEPPSATYEEALEHFEDADRLSKSDWKENKLFIVKCLIKIGRVEEAVKILQEADRIANGGDGAVDAEVKELLGKHDK